MTVGFNHCQETVIEESKEDEMDSQAEMQSQLNASAPGPETSRTSKVDESEKRWKIVFGLLVLATIVVVVVAVAIGHSRDDGSSPPDTVELTTVTAALTPTPVDNLQDQLTILRQGLQANNFTVGYLDLIPTDAESLKGKFSNQDEDAVVRAASWLVHEDPLNQADQLLARFALAVIYLQTGGADWTNSTNWLSGNSICVWYGVRCGDPGHPSDHVLAEKIRELDLENNNLEGQLPKSIALLIEMRVLWLNDNSLSGQVPGEALGSLPVLLILHLNRNQFTGPIPTSFRNNGILDTLYIQGNDFTGDWPLVYCPDPPSYKNHPLRVFGLDCFKNPIIVACHEDISNCFY